MMTYNCPEVSKIAKLEERLRHMEKEMDQLRLVVIANADARHYNKGYSDAKTLIESAPYKKVYKLALWTGSGVLLLLSLLISYIVAGADATLAFIKTIWKVAGL